MRGASRLVLAFATLAAGAAPLEARADWEVRRSTTREHDLAANAERAFTERPEDVALARRLIRLVGATGRAALRTRVCEPARAPTAAATDLLRCATLTFELGGADEEAASTFARAAAARPSLAAFEGEARTLARLGHKDEARARYEAALPFAHRPADERRVLEAALALVDVRAEPARALAFDQRLAALDPRDTTIAERVADDLARLGRSSEAAALLDARLPSANDEERFALSLRAAELYDAAGEHERAAAALAAILARTPRAA
ncbi:MAG TPA: hypothetical protein VHJ20_03175, partial [Polyangia bacterium]|nr:hypothetical protein [Polyangia bacterium]